MVCFQYISFPLIISADKQGKVEVINCCNQNMAFLLNMISIKVCKCTKNMGQKLKIKRPVRGAYLFSRRFD